MRSTLGGTTYLKEHALGGVDKRTKPTCKEMVSGSREIGATHVTHVSVMKAAWDERPLEKKQDMPGSKRCPCRLRVALPAVKTCTGVTELSKGLLLKATGRGKVRMPTPV
jgi:hypothetical protein